MCEKDSSKYTDDISRLKLTTYIEAILRQKGMNKVSDLSGMNKITLKQIPGIGYACARKIMKAYHAYVDQKQRDSLTQAGEQKKTITKVSQLPIGIEDGYIMHPVIAQSSLAEKDKEIINYIIQGYTLGAVQWKLGISKRSLRHRIAVLKIDYAANTLPQLIMNILDDVHTGKKVNS